ncbi:entericidin A/B family lipoprotein [Glycocaulis abyssi]|uniref:Entericidin A/B family lipoprotein n=1 Tax=Glycocaulis abyssi TaxID=1433403 RepID=A0ABV9NEN4_9PROT
MRETLQIMSVAIMIFVLAACNTIQGAGRDIQRGGEAIEDAAD